MIHENKLKIANWVHTAEVILVECFSKSIQNKLYDTQEWNSLFLYTCIGEIAI